MSKKRFTADLEDLLDKSPTETISLEPSFAEKSTTATAAAVRRGPNKRFLESVGLLFEAVELESPATDDGNTQKLGTVLAQTKIHGIDSLIRSTAAGGAELELNFSTSKRVTVALDIKKLEQLKRIAQTEKQYIKDLVNLAVGKFLETYK